MPASVKELRLKAQAGKVVQSKTAGGDVGTDSPSATGRLATIAEPAAVQAAKVSTKGKEQAAKTSKQPAQAPPAPAAATTAAAITTDYYEFRLSFCQGMSSKEVAVAWAAYKAEHPEAFAKPPATAAVSTNAAGVEEPAQAEAKDVGSGATKPSAKPAATRVAKASTKGKEQAAKTSMQPAQAPPAPAAVAPAAAVITVYNKFRSSFCQGMSTKVAAEAWAAYKAEHPEAFTKPSLSRKQTVSPTEPAKQGGPGSSSQSDGSKDGMRSADLDAVDVELKSNAELGPKGTATSERRPRRSTHKYIPGDEVIVGKSKALGQSHAVLLFRENNSDFMWTVRWLDETVSDGEHVNEKTFTILKAAAATTAATPVPAPAPARSPAAALKASRTSNKRTRNADEGEGGGGGAGGEEKGEKIVTSYNQYVSLKGAGRHTSIVGPEWNAYRAKHADKVSRARLMKHNRLASSRCAVVRRGAIVLARGIHTA